MSSMNINLGEGSNPGGDLESGYVNPVFVCSPQEADNVKQLGYSETPNGHVTPIQNNHVTTNGSVSKSRDDNSSTTSKDNGNGKRSIKKRTIVGVKETVSNFTSQNVYISKSNTSKIVYYILME